MTTPRAVEFKTELTGARTLELPPEIASALPASGKVTVAVFVGMDPEDAAWREETYGQFLSDDSEEDARRL
jgi:enterochelin esterase-like enzyme